MFLKNIKLHPFFVKHNIKKMSTYLEGALATPIDEIYATPYPRTYNNYIHKITSINKNLRREGVLSPGEKSYENVKRLYYSLGQNLDSIPVVHVGGTNGKVSIID